jgi:hypothetical protein
MSNPYSSFCEDFYVNLRLASQLNLPHQRETLLHFFERIQKDFPSMTRFRKTEAGEFTLEEDRASQKYRWITLESRRLSAGHINPVSVEQALQLHAMLLQLAPFHLGVSPVEIDYLDVLFGFDLPFNGNHDEIIAESLLADSPLNCLTEEATSRPVDFQPSVTVALSEDCRLQARIDIVTRTSSFQVRTGDYADDVISVCLILRRFWGDRPRQSLEQVMLEMSERAEQLCDRHILPKIVRPISTAIASRS